MKKTYVIGNWKMNKTIEEAITFVHTIDPMIPTYQQKGIIIGICPSFLALKDVVKNNKNLLVAAQNCHYKTNGAYTGEVSIPMLQEIGIRACLVGHSERRLYNHETNESCQQKLQQLLLNKMQPIYCVGETLTQYEMHQTKQVIKEQIVQGLKDLAPQDVRGLIIAYEPVWSIGTGKNASSQIAQDICAYIRQLIKDLYDSSVSQEVVILYGGSVKVENVREYMQCIDVNGVLVGGASLQVDSFLQLIERIE